MVKKTESIRKREYRSETPERILNEKNGDRYFYILGASYWRQ